MSHLTQTGHSYWQHLRRAWCIAGVLLVHGVFPEIWKTRATDLLCDPDHTKQDKTSE
jgi:hypothetical protein